MINSLVAVQKGQFIYWSKKC